MKIKTLTLTDFRAFPGPSPASFELAGKNLLVYGENGSGKSSIFHALKDFFAFKPAKPLKDYKNIYSNEPDDSCKVEVTFNDGAPTATWTVAKHPCTRLPSGRDQRVAQAALRRSCLDYRALLDTNYKHIDSEINLFDIAVAHLLNDYPFTLPGGNPTTVGKLWMDAKGSIPHRHNTASIKRANDAATLFNAAFLQALGSLHPHVSTLLNELTGTEVELAPFEFNGITYRQAWERCNRGYNGCELTPKISFRTKPIKSPHKPHHFLNEARLSALGLAIYFAGRLACIPHATPGLLKLLVLDDVLIGLDHSNRLPVLEVLNKHFADWQVILLTYDRNWFDMARSHLDKSTWSCWEVFEGDRAAAAPIPIIRPSCNRPALQYLQQAKALLAQKYVEAAANYSRQALESAVRGGLELKSVKLAYKRNPKDHKLQDQLDALESWTKEDAARAKKYAPILGKVKTLKNVVLNPYSHPDAPNIPEKEVQEAIDVVDALIKELAKK